MPLYINLNISEIYFIFYWAGGGGQLLNEIKQTRRLKTSAEEILKIIYINYWAKNLLFPLTNIYIYIVNQYEETEDLYFYPLSVNIIQERLINIRNMEIKNRKNINDRRSLPAVVPINEKLSSIFLLSPPPSFPTESR